MTTTCDAHRLDDATLLSNLRALVVRSNETEAEMLEHLAEVDQRKVYLPDHTSLFAFCTAELGFSEAAAENRIAVARAARRFPLLLEVLRSGKVHLSGLRVLVPHLTKDSTEALLEQAAGKSKRGIEELVACHAPRPSVSESIRKVPERRVAEVSPAAPPAPPTQEPGPLLSNPAPASVPAAAATPAPLPPPRPAVVSVLAPDRYHVQLTASRELRDKINEAKALLRHQVPSGDLATILDRALTVLIAKVKKERFGVGRRPRSERLPEGPASNRHVPDAIKRAVFERDGGQCTFVGSNGKRCEERGFLELDHIEGFARRPEHRVSGLRVLCSKHNAYAAEEMYGSEWMARKRQGRTRSTRPGATRGEQVRGAPPGEP